jgi:hypothetical protein
MNIKLDQTHKNPFTFVVHIILVIRQGPKIKFRNNYIYIYFNYHAYGEYPTLVITSCHFPQSFNKYCIYLWKPNNIPLQLILPKETSYPRSEIWTSLRHHWFDKHRLAWTLKNFQWCDVMTNKLSNSMNNANGG